MPCSRCSGSIMRSAADGSLQFEGSASGVFRQPLRVSCENVGRQYRCRGAGHRRTLAQKANLNLKVRSVNLAPLFSLKPSDSAAQNVRLFANLALAGNKLSSTISTASRRARGCAAISR